MALSSAPRIADTSSLQPTYPSSCPPSSAAACGCPSLPRAAPAHRRMKGVGSAPKRPVSGSQTGLPSVSAVLAQQGHPNIKGSGRACWDTSRPCSYCCRYTTCGLRTGRDRERGRAQPARQQQWAGRTCCASLTQPAWDCCMAVCPLQVSTAAGPCLPAPAARSPCCLGSSRPVHTFAVHQASHPAAIVRAALGTGEHGCAVLLPIRPLPLVSLACTHGPSEVRVREVSLSR